MKRTISVNIAGVAYIIDSDAYDRLSSYLDDIAARTELGDEDLLSDIELRMAEIFSEQGADRVRVVTLTMVERAIKQIGSPDIFGKRRESVEPIKAKRGILSLLTQFIGLKEDTISVFIITVTLMVILN